MLSSRSLISQYVSCVIDGGMSVDDVELHSLPMYHCAQLDCFFSVDVYLGPQHHPARPRPGGAAGDDRPRAGDQAVLPADGVDLAAAAPRLRHHRPVEPAQGLLRRYPRCRWRCSASCRHPAARRPALELLRADRDVSLATILRPHEQLERAGSAGRAALNVETTLVDDDGSPCPRCGGRDRAPQPARGAGLLRGRGEDGRGVQGRLVPPATWAC